MIRSRTNPVSEIAAPLVMQHGTVHLEPFNGSHQAIGRGGSGGGPSPGRSPRSRGKRLRVEHDHRDSTVFRTAIIDSAITAAAVMLGLIVRARPFLRSEWKRVLASAQRETERLRFLPRS